MSDNLTLIRRYLDAIENDDDEALASFLHPDVVQREHPNRLMTQGATRDRAAMLQGAQRGRAVITGQRFEILSSISDGDRVAVELVWTATSQVALPLLGRAPGSRLEAKLAIFVTFRDGKILSQDNYDCFL